MIRSADKHRNGPSRRFLGPHIFDRDCIANGIKHRLTKPYHPCTNGQAERMNRIIKDATPRPTHYENLTSLKVHNLTFVTAYSFTKHLKTNIVPRRDCRPSASYARPSNKGGALNP